MMVSLSKAQWPMLNNGPETNTNVDNFPGAQQTRLSTSEPATPYGLPAHLRRDTSQPLRNGRNNRRRTTSIVDAGHTLVMFRSLVDQISSRYVIRVVMDWSLE